MLPSLLDKDLHISDIWYLHSSTAERCRLLDVLMQESKLFLVFEFLSMDLKKYLDSIPKEVGMDPTVIKSYCFQVSTRFIYVLDRLCDE